MYWDVLKQKKLKALFVCLASPVVEHGEQGDYSQALMWHQKALTINEKVLGKEHPHTVVSYVSIGDIYCKQGDYPQTLKWLQKTLEVQEKVLGKKHSDTATTYQNIGVIYGILGDYPQARDSFLKACRVWFHSLGAEHPSIIMTYQGMKKAFVDNGGREDDFMPWFVERFEQ